jgi:hypothetical protein
LVEHRGQVDRIPGHHRIGQQIQARRLMQQFLFLLFPQDPLVGEHQEFTQRVQGLALVELSLDPSPVVLALQV